MIAVGYALLYYALLCFRESPICSDFHVLANIIDSAFI